MFKPLPLSSKSSLKASCLPVASVSSFWADDVYNQVELTMAVVEAILSSRGFGFADLVRAAAYFRHPKDVGAIAEWRRAYELPAFPVVSAQCDVCRDDLLFELEAEAVSAAPG